MGEITFVYQNNKRNESARYWRANNRYIYISKIDGKGYIFGKSSFLNCEPLTMIQTSCNFSPVLMFEFGSIRQCLAFPEKIHG